MQPQTEHTAIHPQAGHAIQMQQTRRVLPPDQPPRARWRKGTFLCCALFALLLAMLLFGPLHHSFAASAALQPCLHAPLHDKSMDCDGQDPILSHCVSNVITALQVPILNTAGLQVGHLDMRFSPVCQTYWGRAFTWLPHVRLLIVVRELLPDPAAQYEGPAPEVYSNMYSGAQPGIEVHVLATPDRTPPSASIAGANE